MKWPIANVHHLTDFMAKVASKVSLFLHHFKQLYMHIMQFMHVYMISAAGSSGQLWALHFEPNPPSGLLIPV